MAAVELASIVCLALAVFLVLSAVPSQPSRRTSDSVDKPLSVASRLGAMLRSKVGLESPNPVHDRLWGYSALLFVLVVVHPAVPVIGLIGIWGQHIAGIRRSRISLEEVGWAAAPEAANVMALAVRSGANVYQAIDVVARRIPGRGGAAFAEVSRRLAMGVLLEEALDELPARLGDAAEPLRRVLRRCVATGAELAPALERVAVELRTQQHQRQLEAARRLPVLLLFPLVTCTLPAFALLTVVPLLVSSLARLAG